MDEGVIAVGGHSQVDSLTMMVLAQPHKSADAGNNAGRNGTG